MSDSIELLKGASEAIESIIKSIQHFTESISESIKKGYETASYIRAQKTEQRLHSIIVHSKQLLSSQMAVMRGNPKGNVDGFLPSIDNFIKSNGVDKSSWKRAQYFASEISEQINLIWKEIENERGDFIFDDSYTELVNAIKLRNTALQGFKKINESKVDMEELEYFYLRYGELYLSLQAAINAVITYTIKYKACHES